MPTLEPPVLDRGDADGPARHARSRHPALLAIGAFVVTAVVTVIVLRLVLGPIGN
jgi:hypothetical protein